MRVLGALQSPLLIRNPVYVRKKEQNEHICEGICVQSPFCMGALQSPLFMDALQDAPIGLLKLLYRVSQSPPLLEIYEVPKGFAETPACRSFVKHPHIFLGKMLICVYVCLYKGMTLSDIVL